MSHSRLTLSEQVGRVYPQAVYFPIRTLYLTLKIEQRERYKSGTSPRGWVPGASGAPLSRHTPTRSSPPARGPVCVQTLGGHRGRKTKPDLPRVAGSPSP